MILTINFKDGSSLEIKSKKITNYEVSQYSLRILIMSVFSSRTETIQLDQVKSYSLEQESTYDGNPILISGILNILNNHLS